MAEMLLDLLEVRPGRDQQRRARVTEVMEAKPVDELGANDRRVVVAAHEVPVPDRTAVTCREHISARRVLRQVVCEHRSKEARDNDRADPAGLRRPFDDPTADLGERPAHLEPATEEIEAVDAQVAELAGAEPAVRRGEDESAVPRVDTAREALDLGCGEEVHFVAGRGARELDADDRTPGDQPVDLCVSKNLAEHLEHFARRVRSHATIEHRGDPLPHVDRADRRDLTVAEHRLDVVTPPAFDVHVRTRRDRCTLDRHPRRRVLTEVRATRPRIDPLSPVERRLLISEPSFGIDLPRKGARSLTAVERAVRRLPANASRVLFPIERHRSSFVCSLGNVESHTLVDPGFNVGSPVADVPADPRGRRAVTRHAPVAQRSDRDSKVPRHVLNRHQFDLELHARAARPQRDAVVGQFGLTASSRSIAFIVDPFAGFRVGVSIVVCEFASAIGTDFLRSARLFVDQSVGALVGLLVTGDYVEHIWWFRKSGTTGVVS